MVVATHGQYTKHANMDRRFLEIMYQQWSQGMTDYAHRWIDFVEMAAKVNGTTADQIMKELQKCHWFIKGD